MTKPITGQATRIIFNISNVLLNRTCFCNVKIYSKTFVLWVIAVVQVFGYPEFIYFVIFTL